MVFMRRPVARVGRPTLLGTAARTAVVAGTATAVTGGMMRHQQKKAVEEQEAAAYEQQMQMEAVQQAAVAQAPPASGAEGGDTMAQLQELASMKSQGLLTDEEFSAAKAKILGS